MGDLMGLFGQGPVMELPGFIGVQGQVELIFPAKFKARLGQGVVPDLRRRMTLRQVGRMGCYFIGNDPVFHVILIGQSQVFFWRDVAQHRGTVPADHGRADSRGDVIVTGSDIGRQRPQGIKRRLGTAFQLFFHVFPDHVHGNMTGTFDHHLHVVLPGYLRQLAKGLQFRILGGITGIRNRTRTQPVTQGEGNVVGLHDLANFFKPGIEEIFLVVSQAPFCQYRPPA